MRFGRSDSAVVLHDTEQDCLSAVDMPSASSFSFFSFAQVVMENGRSCVWTAPPLVGGHGVVMLARDCLRTLIGVCAPSSVPVSRLGGRWSADMLSVAVSKLPPAPPPLDCGAGMDNKEGIQLNMDAHIASTAA